MKNVVSSGHPHVTRAAMDVLRDGGNAFDAVVAAGFASAVVEPGLTSLGGGGFLLARTGQGAATLFDFFVDTPGRGRPGGSTTPRLHPITLRFPASEQTFDVGMGSVAVPGTLRGYLHAHRRLGRLPLKDVLASAVTLAREGVPLTAAQAHVMRIIEPIMTLSEEGRRLFGQDDGYCEEGSMVRNDDLAAFLEELPRSGDREFYEGDLAKRIARDMRAGDGLLTEADLAGYQVIERQPLEDRYRRFTLLTNPAPSFGGPLLLHSLKLLQACWPPGLSFGSTAHLVLLVAVMQEVDHGRLHGRLEPGPDGEEALESSQERIRRAFGGTTHANVCDAEGNVASMTTSNGEGSGYFVPGAGIMLNNMMGEDDLRSPVAVDLAAGRRVASMMSPTLLLEGESVRLALGSGGSKRIRSAMMQVISNVVDFQMTVTEAVESPRIHWDGEHIQVEPGYPEAALRALAARWPLNRWSVTDIYFGGVHAAFPDEAGQGDSRRGGAAEVLEPETGSWS